MEQIIQKIEKKEYKSLSVKSVTNPTEIENALDTTLRLQTKELKSRIIKRHIEYLNSKFSIPDYKIKVFIAYSSGKPCGYVVSDLNPEYKSYGRKCGTFGWLNTNNFETCRELLKQCELFVKKCKFRKIRGPINFPKNEMGFGLQIEGINQQLLYGVSQPNPNSALFNYLQDLNYEVESEYTCLRVDKVSWKKGNKLDKNLKLCCLPVDELRERLDEIVDLAKDSFSAILPDTSGGGEKNIENLLELATSLPKANFGFHENPDLFAQYKHIPEFIQAWKEGELENMVTMFPMVFERSTNKLIGMLIGVLDYYQYWIGDYVSRVNVHTAMVRRGYNGKGVFSSLNNFGQATNRSMRGITYFEGTAVWTKNSRGVNNEGAVSSIFPHCTPIRKHVVFEKRVK
ncbi:hypothetical protein LCGC14_1696060 [marine sediment metagenome]|uniref:N-acetyltransferase domain-containing protein n=1 Tax=marine sediment metagenome TaxID=412755 RepID=A0A0F9I6Z5_9ZZZZ